MHYRVIIDSTRKEPPPLDWLPRDRAALLPAHTADTLPASPHAGHNMTPDHFKDLFNAVLEAVIGIPGAVDAINAKVELHEYRRR